jgi:hypothetical protein
VLVNSFNRILGECINVDDDPITALFGEIRLLKTNLYSPKIGKKFNARPSVVGSYLKYAELVFRYTPSSSVAVFNTVKLSSVGLRLNAGELSIEYCKNSKF